MNATQIGQESAGAAGAWVALAVVGICAMLALASLEPPAVVPASAPASAFSAERALARLEHLLGDETPHPSGSGANVAVRDRLLEQLRDLGLNPEVQATVGCSARWPRCAFVENVIAEIPGASDQALVLMAHYDSVPHAPGAGDDGAGVAALLETARALLAGPTLGNDVLLLFTDAEELGLLGAEAFFAEHPRVADVKAVVNVEGSGSGGPSLVLRASEVGGHLVRAAQATATAPVAYSYAQEVFARMPNDTDFTVPDRMGIASIDYAFAFEFNHYHTPLDTIANLDPRTLQHHGDNLLPLARRLGDTDLAQAAPPPAFMTVQQAFWLVWPRTWSLPLVAGAWALLVVAMVRRRETLTGWRLPVGVGVAVLTLLGALIMCWLAGLIGRWIHGTVVPFPAEMRPFHFAMLAAIALAVAKGAWLLRRWTSFWSLQFGAWILLGILATVLAVIAPLAANLLIAPMLLVALVFALAPPDAGAGTGARVRLALGALSLAAVAYPMIAIAEAMAQTQGLRLAPGIYVPLALAGLPALALLGGARAALVAGLAWLGALVWIASVPLYSEWRPQHLSVQYIADLDEGRAYWSLVARNPVPERVMEVFDTPPAAGDALPWSSGARDLIAAAPAVPWRAPDVAVARDGDETVLRLRSYTGGQTLLIAVPAAAQVRAIHMAGREVPLRLSGDWLLASFHAAGSRWVELRLQRDALEPVTVFVADGGPDLPAIAGEIVAARGALAVPQHRGDQRLGVMRVEI